MNKTISIIILSLLLIVPITAQNPRTIPDTVYSIESCYQMVKENYPLLKRYELINLTEKYTLKNAFISYYPQIALTGSASYQTKALEFPFEIPGLKLPTYSKDQYTAMIELSQVLWDGGVIAAERANIKAKSEIEKQQQEADMYALRERVNELYFGILLLKEQLHQTEIVLEDLETQYKKIQNCIANGVANESDLDIMDVEKITRNQNRNNILSLTETYLRMLTLMTGVKINSSDMLIEPIPDEVNKEEMLTELILGDIRRPELKIFDARIKEAETQLDYWTAGGLPKLRLFLKGGYGRPGLNMMENKLSLYALGGVQLVWNISELYNLSYGKKIVKYSKNQINTLKDTFIFNTNLQSEKQVSEIKRYFKIINDDESILALRKKIKISTEHEVENGTKNASDLILEINKENLAAKEMALHKIELMKSLYELKTIKNN